LRDQDGVERTSWSCNSADSWNLFDFIIVLGTMFGLILKYSVGLNGINAITTLIRTFRVARIFRLVNSPFLKKLKTLLQTIGLSLPSIGNLAIVLLLFLSIFAILGMQLFATVGHNDALGDHANFYNFPIALLTLFRGTTGENWNGIMHSIARGDQSENCSTTIEWDPEYCGFCEWNEIYNGGDALNCMDCKPLDGCGMPVISEVFFLAYTFVLTYMIMNIFIAVILEAYEQSNLDESAIVTEENLTNFQEQWALLDTDSNQAILLEHLPEFMDSLPYPMGFKKPELKAVRSRPPLESYEESSKRCVFASPNLDSDGEEQLAKMPQMRSFEKQSAIDEMQIHSFIADDGSAQVKFHDVLFACTQRAYQHKRPSLAFGIDNSHREILQHETKTMKSVPIKTSHYLSALRIAQAYRAHKFRSDFIGKVGHTFSRANLSEEKRSTPEAFAAVAEGSARDAEEGEEDINE